MVKGFTPEMQRAWDEMNDEVGKLKIHFKNMEPMFQRWGVIGALSRLMVSGDVQPGFRKLIEIGRPELTFEAFIVRFPGVFNREVVAAAAFRLRLVAA